jgi:signal transduction histidine kinase
VPVRDDHGTITCWAGINLDISSMKAAEQKLHDSEERLRLALSAGNLAAWDWHLPSGTIIWSDEHYRMLGYEPGAVTPSYRAWIDRLHPDDLVSTEARIRESMAAGSSYAAEFRTLWPDGTVRWLEALGEFTCDDAGQPFRSYGVMMDRTSQAEAEAALQQAYHELTDANVDLEAFNYSVSHDLRSPLTVISGYCQMVQKSCGSSLDERCRGYLGEIYDGTLRMTRLVETLLGFSSVTRSEMHHEKVNLSKMAEEAAMILQEDGPERRVTFRIADGITADGDAVLLRSVLDNLITNAWKFSGKREGTVIEFGATECDGKSTFFVRDNGPGFDSAHLDILFLPFQRLPGTAVGGHGIGLATVDRIIRRHGGRVWAEGEPGKGACFYFTLGAD